jgi:hypothetical protein
MRKRQSGIFLVSAAIAVAVVGMLITFWGINYSRQMRTEKAERIGDALKVMGSAVEAFTVKYRGEIEALFESNKSFSVKGIAFNKLPDVGGHQYMSNLSADNIIRVMGMAGVSTAPPPGVGEYGIQVYRVCDKTVTPKVCSINSLTYLTEPMKRTYSSEADIDFAAVVARRAGVFGGISTNENAGQFRFLDENKAPISVSNPRGVAGLVAVRGGAQIGNMDLNLRRDGSLPMTSQLNMTSRNAKGKDVHHDIVGAGNISGNGKLSMGSLQTSVADVGALTATGAAAFKQGATITGTTNIRGTTTISGKTEIAGDTAIDGTLSVKREGGGKSATTVAPDSVTADWLKSASGVVELSGQTKEGDSCDVWGIARDADGRILSCQNVKGSRVWKLSAPRSKNEIPDVLIKEITDQIYGNEKWTLTEYNLFPSALMRYLEKTKSTEYRLTGAGRVVFCTLDSGGKVPVDGVTITYKSGSYVISGPTRRPVVCLAKGNAAAGLVMTHYTSGPFSSAVITPSKYTESAGEINARLERLAMPPSITSTVSAQTMLGGLPIRTGRMDTTRIEGAVSCSVDWSRSSMGGNGGNYRMAPIFEADSDGTPMLKYSPMDYIWVSCNFRNHADARRAGFPI